MDKKITRRAVLGTAVATLVAGPFVIRGMRGSRVMDLDEAPPLLTAKDVPAPPMPSVKSRFFNEWETYCRKFVSPEVVQDAPLEVELTPDLSAEKKWKFLKIDTHIQGVHSDIEEHTVASGNAMYYEVIEGDVVSGSGKLVVSVTANELRMVVGKENPSNNRVTIEVGKDGSVSATHAVFPVDDIKVQTRKVGSFEFSVKGDGFFAPRTLPFLRPASVSSIPDSNDAEGVMLHSRLLSAMAFPYTGSSYVPGGQIVIPASTVVMSGNWGIPRTLAVGAFKKLNGKLFVPIWGELALDPNQLDSYYRELIRSYVKESMPKSWDGSDEVSLAQLETMWQQTSDNMLATVGIRVEREKQRHEKLSWFLDVETGLVLQSVRCRRPFDTVNGFTTFEHFQMLES